MNSTANDRIDTVCPDRAIVMGASMAGLLAARVLSERFGQVLVLERDALPDWPALRKGTPHAGHAHGLLVRGREVLEELFPGFTQSLHRRGAFVGDMQRDVAFLAGGRRFAQGVGGRIGLCASRPIIEDEVRRRVKGLANVRICDRVDGVEPVYDAARKQVVGVRVRRPATADAASSIIHLDPAQGICVPDDAETWLADLVIDATGRGSRTPQWLRKWGFEPAVEERIGVNVHYATAYYERRSTDAGCRGGVTPWQVAAGADLAIPGVQGKESLPMRLVNRYLKRLFHAARYDSTVALSFVRVVHMIATPASLFKSATMLRVLWRNLHHPAPIVRCQPGTDSARSESETSAVALRS